MYADGLGLDQDYKQAALWYQRSANQGYAAAMADLGDLYFYGNGVRQDQREALRWYRQGADHGDPEAEYDYGLIFHDGSGGQKRSFDAAMKWFLRAAAQGHAAALNMVGYMHDMGEGVKEDPSEAVKWYQKAADKGFEVAEYNLGVMYQSGRGVEKNLATAARWYRAAAEQGDSDSQASLGYLYEQGLGVNSDVAQAISWYKAAARQGSSRALNNLGVLYHDGTGVPRNLVYAYVLYALAADKAEESRRPQARRQQSQRRRQGAFLHGAGPGQGAAPAGGEQPGPRPAAGPLGECRHRPRSPQIALGRRRRRRGPPPRIRTNRHAVPTQPSGPGSLIGTVKTALAALGYDPGSRDNTLNDKTVTAIKAFQKDTEPAPVRRDLLRSPGRLAGLALRGEQCQQDRDQHDDLAQAQALCHGLRASMSPPRGISSPISMWSTAASRCACRAAPWCRSWPWTRRTIWPCSRAPKPGREVARFRDGRGVRTGDSILIAGFPLRDEISSELNVTTGNVSSLAGPDNDRTLIQITAPVQHGNSGGPVLDFAGHVVAVVQSKFDPTADTGDDNTIDVPQNVNFAVSANLLRSFLDAQDVDYESEPSATHADRRRGRRPGPGIHGLAGVLAVGEGPDYFLRRPLCGRRERSEIELESANRLLQRDVQLAGVPGAVQQHAAGRLAEMDESFSAPGSVASTRRMPPGGTSFSARRAFSTGSGHFSPRASRVVSLTDSLMP